MPHAKKFYFGIHCNIHIICKGSFARNRPAYNFCDRNSYYRGLGFDRTDLRL
jgi:hypothetical protein